MGVAFAARLLGQLKAHLAVFISAIARAVARKPVLLMQRIFLHHQAISSG